MTKGKIKKILSVFQLIFLNISYYFCLLVKNHLKKKKFIIGTHEIAKNIYSLGILFYNSATVCLSENKYYKLKYNYSLKFKNKFIKFICRFFYGPILLGYLINKADIFLYVWCDGFLYHRDYEFKFLKLKKKKIICFFCGDDIRSLKLTISYMKNLNLDCSEDYYEGEFDEKYDSEKKNIAFSADTYADLIFSSQLASISYLKSKQHFFRLSCDKEIFNKNPKKFDNIKIKILHAPSNKIYKGTQLIRAAIKKLQIEGYNFNYVELQNESNDVVLDHLRSTHIVLNQFYSFAPGLFGVEAMANNCAVLMSADPKLYESTPNGSENAWLITRYWEVYDNIKYLLKNPGRIKFYADNGYEFALKHHTSEITQEYYNKILKENNILY